MNQTADESGESQGASQQSARTGLPGGVVHVY
ncbi:MAG: hypothetical protein RIT02_3252, partial [Planctomycetota bacterium]